jgi:hypothetical protein
MSRRRDSSVLNYQSLLTQNLKARGCLEEEKTTNRKIVRNSITFESGLKDYSSYLVSCVVDFPVPHFSPS